MTFYKFLDYFFLIFHSTLIVFNVFGWIWEKTKKWNLITLLLTLISWTLLGLFYGWGYCPLTDWHWEVLIKLGKEPKVNSYIQYLFIRLLNIPISSQLADGLAIGFLAISLMASLFVNLFKKNP